VPDRCYQAAHDEELPLADRLAIRLAFSYLLQYSSAGRQRSEAALSAAAVAVTAANEAVADEDDDSSMLGDSSSSRGMGNSNSLLPLLRQQWQFRQGGAVPQQLQHRLPGKEWRCYRRSRCPSLSRSTESERRRHPGGVGTAAAAAAAVCADSGRGEAGAGEGDVHGPVARVP